MREVYGCQNEFVCCVVFQGVQHESFTDLFGPPDLLLPSLVEKESNSVFVLSTSPSHKYVATLCFPRFLMTFVAQPN